MKMCQSFEINGYETTLFLCRSDDDLDIKDTELFDVYGIKDKFNLLWLNVAQGKWAFRWMIFIKTLNACSNFDICYTRNFIAAFACLCRGKKSYYEVHSPTLPKIGKLIMRLLIRSKNVTIITISEELSKILAKNYRVKTERFIVEHDAHDPGTGDIFESNLEEEIKDINRILEGNRLKALYVGSFYPGRGIETISNLASRYQDIDFIAVGAVPEYTPHVSIKNELSNFFYFNRIAHRNVSKILEKADVLLMPYGNRVTIDGLGDTAKFSSPLKLFEYLSAGKPIVASCLPSICEVLINDVNALLVEPENVDDWGAALLRLKNDPSLRSRLSENAHDTSKKFTWDERVKRIISTQ